MNEEDLPDQADAVIVVADEAHAGQRLDRVLAEAIGDLSRSRLQSLIRSGAVLRGDEPVDDPKRKVTAGDCYTVNVPPPLPAEPIGEHISLAIHYEDDHLIVIDKPAGLVVHPSAGHETGTLVNALIAHCGAGLSGIGGVQRPGIVHRLDKDTSGLLVVAKTDPAHRGLSEQFQSHGVDGRLHRAYRALVWGRPLHVMGRIEAPIGRSSQNRLKMAVVSEMRGRFAATRYEVLEVLGGRSGCLEDAASGQVGVGVDPSDAPPVIAELRLELETGRTHQIRVHLAHIGHPVVGDMLYATGFRSRSRRFEAEIGAALDATRRQMLHAGELGFEHPVTGEALLFASEPPADYRKLKEHLNEV